MPPRLVMAADIGGTFTDIAAIDEAGVLRTGKLLTTADDLADGVIEGLRDVAAARGRDLRDIDEVLHATTIATNAILEHKGARTALVTTRGFRDVLELRRIRVPRLYEPLYEKPPPLVPRRHRFEITERTGPRGEVLVPLATAELAPVVEALRAARIEAVAVALLHAYANPAHEIAVAEALRAALPGVFVTHSADVLPEMREYERTSTTVINAYVGPPVHRYLGALVDRLAGLGAKAGLRVMHSGGGVIDAATAMRRPAQIVECGPAAGVIGAAKVGVRSGYRNIITLDMGGTTAKASMIEDGRLRTAEDYEVGGGVSLSGPLVMGGGYALRLPVIDLAEVGAGGGSIVRLDAAGGIKVGPDSAGSRPGPACYGLGGRAPTVTDADVVLGYLNPRALAGGRVPIDAELARRALADTVARPLARRLEDVAFGVHELANATMTRAIKSVSTYRGRDPRDFALFGFGGCGGVHGWSLAAALGMRTVVVPVAAGVFSALGLLLADNEVAHSIAHLRRTDDVDGDEVEALFRSLEAKARVELRAADGAVTIERAIDMRFKGQFYDLRVPVDDAPREGLGRWLAARFVAAHERAYGYPGNPGNAVQTAVLRLTARAVTADGVDGWRWDAHAGAPATAERRRAYFGPDGWHDTAVVARVALARAPRPGPLIVEEVEGTVVVPPRSTARLDGHGNIVIEAAP